MQKTKIIFASGNAGKIKEMTYLINKHLAGDDDPGVPTEKTKNVPPTEIELLSLKDIGFTDEIIEDGETFEENAEKKARAVFDKTGMICFADDSGLCVDYLNGGPGVDTSGYGGIEKLLDAMKDVPDDKRTAYFNCTICCIISSTESFFVSAQCGGIITHKAAGDNGFGYDPVFYFPSYGKTFAQLADEEKNKVSHRAKAAEQFAKKIVKYII
jgi:XTP/dITP diphosphohydrolase